MSVFRFDGWEAEISPRGGSAYAINIDGVERVVRLLSSEEGLVSFEVDGRTVHVAVEILGDRIEVTLAGRLAAFPLDPAESGPSAPSGGALIGPVRAELPGRVLEVRVSEGDLVEAGQVLAVVEAMKMEHPIRAGAPARVGKVHVEAGAQIKPGDVLLDLLPVEAQ